MKLFTQRSLALIVFACAALITACTQSDMTEMSGSDTATEAAAAATQSVEDTSGDQIQSQNRIKTSN